MTTESSWPKVTATTNADGSGDVTVGGTHHPLNEATLDAARATAVHIIADTAASLGRPLHAITIDPDGTWPLIIQPDGTVTEDPDRTAQPAAAAPTGKRSVQEDPATEPALDDAAGGADAWVHTHIDPEPTPLAEETEPHLAAQGEVQGRHSFLKVQQIEQPATQGWRGLATRLGLRVSPSEDERAERADVHAVSQHWPGPRTIVVANGKGGAGKTPTVVLLSAVFARYGGAGVLAWDNNQTRGTLGWRTEQGPHTATVFDLLPQVQRLLGTGAQSADLAHYVHHQTADRFDVLRSKPIQLRADQRIRPEDVDAIWDVGAKFYRVIVVDTGNDESDAVWLAALEHADQIVVPTTTRADHAEAGALLLDALRGRDQHSRQLAEDAVAIVTQADPRASKTDIQNVVDGYSSLARNVVTIPHDPAIVDGILQWDSLRPATQRAWLRAAADVAQGL
ncbi:AAA family ATPase [Propionibacterium sp.]|uniref:MinD/ParA family ATP-binding protein n=1 Tax=Propionibacterium sp. TaxID=1977903 RepID=UPI0039EBA74E